MTLTGRDCPIRRVPDVYRGGPRTAKVLVRTQEPKLPKLRTRVRFPSPALDPTAFAQVSRGFWGDNHAAGRSATVRICAGQSAATRSNVCPVCPRCVLAAPSEGEREGQRLTDHQPGRQMFAGLGRGEPQSFEPHSATPTSTGLSPKEPDSPTTNSPRSPWRSVRLDLGRQSVVEVDGEMVVQDQVIQLRGT